MELDNVDSEDDCPDGPIEVDDSCASGKTGR